MEHFHLNEIRLCDKIKEALLWTENSKNVMTLHIGDDIPIPEIGYHNNLKIGLGW